MSLTRHDIDHIGHTLAVLCLALVAGVTAGWFAHQKVRDGAALQQLRAELVSACRNAHQTFAGGKSVSVEFHPDKLDAYNKLLRKRAKLQVSLPDLKDAGVTFLGARIFPLRGLTAALLVFQHDKQRFSLLGLPASDESLFGQGWTPSKGTPVTVMADGAALRIFVGKTDPAETKLLADAIQAVN